MRTRAAFARNAPRSAFTLEKEAHAGCAGWRQCAGDGVCPLAGDERCHVGRQMHVGHAWPVLRHVRLNSASSRGSHLLQVLHADGRVDERCLQLAAPSGARQRTALLESVMQVYLSSRPICSIRALIRRLHRTRSDI